MKEYLLKYFNEDLINQVLVAKKYIRLYKPSVININLDVIKILYEDYKLPIYKIAMLYGVSDVTIRNYFLKYEITTLKGHKVGKNSENNYFENIDTFDKAYFLGLIVADGNIINLSSNTKNKKRLSLELTEEDKYILEKFNSYANLNSHLIKCHKNDLKPRYRISICSIKIYDDLYNLGLRDNKSKLGTEMPKLKEELIPHFIRGYFDGDGIAFKQGYVGFCGSKNILEQIHDYLKKQGMSPRNIWFNKYNHIYYIQWTSLKDRKLFCEIIYNDKQDLFLKRKYIKITNKLN